MRFELAMALVSKGVHLDIIGSDEIDSPELHTTPNLRFLDFRGSQKNHANFVDKLWKLLVYYAKLMRYAAHSKPKTFHILWNNKIEVFDRTILMMYYKVLGKKIALTAHNVNQARRDARDSWLNRATLKTQYRLCDHMFVHTQKMKDELCQDFDVAEKAVTVIRHPVNNGFPIPNSRRPRQSGGWVSGTTKRRSFFSAESVPIRGSSTCSRPSACSRRPAGELPVNRRGRTEERIRRVPGRNPPIR